MRPARQPCPDLRGFVGGIVVHDDMHVRTLWHLPVDLFEKVQELRRPMPFVAFADRRSGGNVERGKQRCGAVVDVRMSSPLSHARCIE